jgi:hypothetical protein
MKSEAGKPRKHRQPVGSKVKPLCGTLTYLAECRGMAQKTSSAQKNAPPEIIDRNIRKYPAAP